MHCKEWSCIARAWSLWKRRAGNEAGRAGASLGAEGEGEMCASNAKESASESHGDLIYSILVALPAPARNMYSTFCRN